MAAPSKLGWALLSHRPHARKEGTSADQLRANARRVAHEWTRPRPRERTKADAAHESEVTQDVELEKLTAERAAAKASLDGFQELAAVSLILGYRVQA